jgi:hypothetical protein
MKVAKETQLKLYKVLGVPVLLYGSAIMYFEKKDENKITPAEMKFLHAVKKCTREDRVSNQEIRQNL